MAPFWEKESVKWLIETSASLDFQEQRFTESPRCRIFEYLLAKHEFLTWHELMFAYYWLWEFIVFLVQVIDKNI